MWMIASQLDVPTEQHACVDGVNQYNCVCQAGFTGELCDQGEKNNSPERGLWYSSI